MSCKSDIFFFVSIYDEIYENSVFNGQNKAANAKDAQKNRRSLAAKKALARRRKADTRTHFKPEKLFYERTHTFFYKV